MQELDLRLPHVETGGRELCVCYSVLLQRASQYNLLAFRPMVEGEEVNHMSLVSGWGRESFPYREEGRVLGRRQGGGREGGEVWDREARECSTGAGSSSGQWQKLGPRTLYIWGRGAGGLQLPAGVAVHVGAGERLVLQVHYRAGAGGGRAGVKVLYTEEEVEARAGILSLHAGGVLPPGSDASLEAGCPLLGRQALQPLAFLVHTHSLGTSAGLWRREAGSSREAAVGQASPQAPQAWRGVQEDSALLQGDTLVARCTFHNSGNNSVVTGPSRDKEMCAVYLLYTSMEPYRLAHMAYCLRAPVG